ncbi:ABC transporter permease [Salsipaludibacter albus]|uniref:ABC transporter permease n=1 Tax=Salsipaludibacter albus TaxID=2849650 RepID=UPI001EE42941|nr:ABC transporter permease [Salsipaludibacter albus]MBY5161705.1 ABC transporter permease [Salsipaludibacter albus]
MTAVRAIAGTSLRRFLRDRSNYFFVFVFPMILVVLIGLQFGSESASGRALVVGGSDLAGRVTDALEARDVQVARADSVADAQERIARGRADAAVVVEADDDRSFAAGEPTDLAVITGTSTDAIAVQQIVGQVVAGVGGTRVAELALVDAGVDDDTAREALAAASGTGPTVVVSTAGGDGLAEEFAGLGEFDLGAAQQVSLFVFLASLAGATSLIQSRQLGVTRRELAAPVTTGQVIAGEALGRFAVALAQGAYIVVGTALLFGVDWGDPVATALVLTLFCAVSASAAMVFGASLDNENVAGGVGVGVGLVVAALGGSMLPLELFPDTLRTVSGVTPHHWAYQAYAEISRRGGGVADVLPQVAVLALMTAILLPLGAWLLRRSLQRAL